jgi:hypothetical protein
MTAMTATSPALTTRELAEIVGKPHAFVHSQVYGMLEYDLQTDATQFEFVYRKTANKEHTEFRLGRKLVRHFMTTHYPDHLRKALRRLNKASIEMPDVPATAVETTLQPLELEWTGVSFAGIGDDAFPLSDFTHWIAGTEHTIRRAMRQAGLMTAKWEPTDKGEVLIGGKRGGEYLFKARATLKELGVWR